MFGDVLSVWLLQNQDYDKTHLLLSLILLLLLLLLDYKHINSST